MVAESESEPSLTVSVNSMIVSVVKVGAVKVVVAEVGLDKSTV